MANYFRESEDRPILSSWIEQGFTIDKPYVLEAIETDRQALEKDTQLSTVVSFGSIGAGCLMLALGGITAPLIIPIGMIAAAGLTAWNSDCAKSDRELEVKFLRAYPAVFDRLSQRISEGETVSRIASDYGLLLKAYRRADRTALASLVDAPGQTIAPTPAIVTAGTFAPTVLQPIDDAKNNAESPRAKDETLGISGVQPIAIVQDATTAAAPSIQHITPSVWNPAKDLGENPQSALIVGVPGSGKGMLVSNAIRTLKAKYPDLKIFVIDPKADPKERGYWEGLADRYCAFSLMQCSDPDDGAEWLLNCMAEFTLMSGPKLCIFDELMSASTELSLANKELKALSRLKKFVVGLIGQGDSQGAWLWAMTQSPQVSDMGMSGGVRANLRAIGLVSPKNMAAVEALTSTKLIPPPPGGMDELREIMAASPVGRAVFDGKISRWLPMPKLENHSGFDRDNRSLSSSVLVPELITAPKPTIAPISQSTEVETMAIIDRPIGLNAFPLVASIWNYLDGKEARSMKQIRDAMRKTERITEDDLKAKFPNIEGYSDALKNVIQFGVGRGYLREVSEDTYEAIRKH